MIAYFLLFLLVGFIAHQMNNAVLGLITVIALALFLGIHWLPLDLLEFGIGYWLSHYAKQSR